MTTWDDRDLPVLQFLAGRGAGRELLTTHRLSEDSHDQLPELTERDVYRAITTLVDAGYVEYGTREAEGGGDVMWIDLRVTGTGKQVLGDWPLFASLGEPAQLAALLEHLAHQAASDEEEQNFRKAAAGVRRFGSEGLQQLLVGVGLKIAQGQL